MDYDYDVQNDYDVNNDVFFIKWEQRISKPQILNLGNSKVKKVKTQKYIILSI